MSELISDQYRRQLEKLHQGASFGKRRKMPLHLAEFIQNVNPASIIDFGCGKGNLVSTLRDTFPNISVRGYDPAVQEHSASIDDVKVDLLISTDALEHVEPNHIDHTLAWLRDRSRYIYHLISLAPAKRRLPDGRNAHLIQESPQWWRAKFQGLGYEILSEDYREFEKTPSGWDKPLPVRHYTIMGVLLNP